MTQGKVSILFFTILPVIADYSPKARNSIFFSFFCDFAMVWMTDIFFHVLVFLPCSGFVSV